MAFAHNTHHQVVDSPAAAAMMSGGGPQPVRGPWFPGPWHMGMQWQRHRWSWSPAPPMAAQLLARRWSWSPYRVSSYMMARDWSWKRPRRRRRRRRRRSRRFWNPSTFRSPVYGRVSKHVRAERPPCATTSISGRLRNPSSTDESIVTKTENTSSCEGSLAAILSERTSTDGGSRTPSPEAASHPTPVAVSEQTPNKVPSSDQTSDKCGSQESASASQERSPSPEDETKCGPFERSLSLDEFLQANKEITSPYTIDKFIQSSTMEWSSCALQKPELLVSDRIKSPLVSSGGKSRSPSPVREPSEVEVQFSLLNTLIESSVGKLLQTLRSTACPSMDEHNPSPGSEEPHDPSPVQITTQNAVDARSRNPCSNNRITIPPNLKSGDPTPVTENQEKKINEQSEDVPLIDLGSLMPDDVNLCSETFAQTLVESLSPKIPEATLQEDVAFPTKRNPVSVQMVDSWHVWEEIFPEALHSSPPMEALPPAGSSESRASSTRDPCLVTPTQVILRESSLPKHPTEMSTDVAQPKSVAVASPSPGRSRSPSPVAVASLSPGGSRSTSPVAVVSPTPRRSRSPSPVAVASPSPGRSRSPLPVAVVSPTPGRSRSLSPVAVASPSPGRSRSTSPVAVVSPTPRRSRSPSPVAVASPSPGRSRSLSPVAVVSPTTGRSRSLSPVAVASPSPGRSKSPLPVAVTAPSSGRSKSPLPVAVASPSPWRSRSPSPVAVASPSPGRSRSPLPVAVASPSPWRNRSPSPWRNRSPSPVAVASPSPGRTRSPLPVAVASPSPWRSRNPSPVAVASPSPGRSRSPSPVAVTFPSQGRSRSPSPVASPSPWRSRSPSPIAVASSSPGRTISPIPVAVASPSPWRSRSLLPVAMASPSPGRSRSPSPVAVASPSQGRSKNPLSFTWASPSPGRSRSLSPVAVASPSPGRSRSPLSFAEASPSPGRSMNPLSFTEASPSPGRSRSPSPVAVASPSPGRSRSPLSFAEASPSPGRSRSPLPVAVACPSPGSSRSPLSFDEASPSPGRSRSPLSLAGASPPPWRSRSPLTVAVAPPSPGRSRSPSPVAVVSPSSAVGLSCDCVSGGRSEGPSRSHDPRAAGMPSTASFKASRDGDGNTSGVRISQFMRKRCLSQSDDSDKAAPKKRCSLPSKTERSLLLERKDGSSRSSSAGVKRARSPSPDEACATTLGSSKNRLRADLLATLQGGPTAAPLSPGNTVLTRAATERLLRRAPNHSLLHFSNKRVEVFQAVQEGKVERVQQLVQDIGPAIRSTDTNCTLLHTAASCNQLDVLIFLLKLISPNVVDDQGQTPAHVAAARGHTQVLRILLADQQMKREKRDNCSRTYEDLLSTPLIEAVAKGNRSRVQELVKLGADPDYRADTLLAGGQTEVTTARQLALALNRHDMMRCFPKERPREAPLEVCPSHTFSGNLQPIPAASQLSPALGPDVYQVEGRPRGHVCILNYSSFQDRSDLRLEGSRPDVLNLANVFGKMGYSGHAYESLTAGQTQQVLTTLRDSRVLDQAGCAIFIISSHGVGEEKFLTSDMKLLTTEWVCDLFKDSECPRLRNKAKIFIFDFWCGYYKEESSRHGGRRRVTRVEEPLRDVMCLYSSSGGFSSYSFSKEGTPFIRAWCHTLQHHAHDKELADFYREFLTEYSKTSPSSTPQLRNIGFTKRFYFNPGTRM